MLGLAITLAAGFDGGVTRPGRRALGFLTGIADGMFAYMGAAHLLPDAQAECSSRITGTLFAATFIVTTLGLLTVWATSFETGAWSW